jgi:hypothetical protein
MGKVTAKELKSKIGESIWIVPQSNSLTRGKPQHLQIQEVELVKVGSKTFEFKNKSSSRSFDGNSYPIDGGNDRNNFGYIPFLTEQDAKNYFLIKDFDRNLRYDFNIYDLTFDEISQIVKIIDKKGEIKTRFNNLLKEMEKPEKKEEQSFEM